MDRNGKPLNGGPPKVIAHRGSSHVEPEHTLGAYERAIAEGADGIECDVRLTADRHLVCVHDRRVNRTSNGKGVVSDLELAHLEDLDWGSWKRRPDTGDPEEPDRNQANLLTLRQLILTALAANRPLDLVIETKHPTRYAGEVERQLVQVLHEFDLLIPGNSLVTVRAMSFSTLAMQRLAKYAPHLQRVLLIEPGAPLPFRDGLPRGVAIAGPGMPIVRRHRGFVQKHHAAGHQVHVWTVDKPRDIEICLDLGVDAIITNKPSVVREAVDAVYPGGVRR
ncbi:glycerophosphodiester phosphodiesterase [Leekyejoonella antrihumi]|uniref:glycerophosphodiester phosphodiesterase n=1 Tax=Leekyejoonella antrihumi TaxID=1660198 RepID=UPI001C987E16|nr:glycerophosphodiester phosphodiesterase family protein [Leekyejoonella antrihumi]